MLLSVGAVSAITSVYLLPKTRVRKLVGEFKRLDMAHNPEDKQYNSGVCVITRAHISLPLLSLFAPADWLHF